MTFGRTPAPFSLASPRTAVPLVSLVALLVVWRLGIPWATVPIAAFALFYYFLLPRIVRLRLARFEREALRLLTTGKAADVPRLASRDLVLKLFGPAPPMDAKLGLAYAATGDFASAVGCFRRAIPSAPPAERPALAAGLVKALFVTGDLASAEAEGRSVLESITALPEVMAVTARCRVGLGKLDDETRRLLDEAEGCAPSKDARLMIDLSRIELALAAGRRAGDVPDGADSSQAFLRGWIHLVEGKLRQERGKVKEAADSYRHAIAAAGDGFVSAEARVRLAAVDAVPEDGADRPARKRRKRR